MLLSKQNDGDVSRFLNAFAVLSPWRRSPTPFLDFSVFLIEEASPALTFIPFHVFLAAAVWARITDVRFAELASIWILKGNCSMM